MSLVKLFVGTGIEAAQDGLGEPRRHVFAASTVTPRSPSQAHGWARFQCHPHR